MNIKKITAAVACLTAVPTIATASETDFSFYGSLRPMVELTDHDNGDDFKDAVSRVGVKGSHDLGNGLSAFARIELRVEMDEGQIGDDQSGNTSDHDPRLANIGLKGDFGRLSFGRDWGVFYNAVGYAGDMLWWNSAPVYYTTNSDSIRVGKAVSYTSPEFGGAQLSIASSENSDRFSDDADNVEAALTFKPSDGLRLALSYIDEGASDDDTVGVAAFYSGDGFYVNGAYMDKDNVGKGADLVGGMTVDKSLYTVGLSTYEDESGGNGDFDAVILAYQYNIHPSVKLWAEFMAWDGSLYGVQDSESLAFGMNYDF